MCCSTGGGRQARGVGAEPARAQAETGVRRHHRYHPLPWGAGTRPRTLPPRRGTTCPPATSGRVVAGAPRRSGQRPLTAAGTRACSRPQGPPHPRPPCSSLIQRPGRQPGPSAAGRCDSPPPSLGARWKNVLAVQGLATLLWVANNSPALAFTLGASMGSPLGSASQQGPLHYLRI